LTDAASPPLLSLHAVGRSYGRFRALDHVDLEIRAAETVALFGGNGAGKTTLLKIAATLLAPTHGHLHAAGKALRGTVRAAYRHALGFAGHATFLYGDLSAEENLILHARLHGTGQPAKRAADMLRRVGLWERRGEMPVNFSRGMQQRASLGRALIGDPELLLLDEPFSGLDNEGATVVDEVLREHRAGGRSTLVVSHNLARTLALADRFVVLERGSVAAEGACAPFRHFAAHEITLERLYAGPA